MTQTTSAKFLPEFLILVEHSPRFGIEPSETTSQGAQPTVSSKEDRNRLEKARRGYEFLVNHIQVLYMYVCKVNAWRELRCVGE